LTNAPYNNSSLMVWVNREMQALLYDYTLETVAIGPGWQTTDWDVEGWDGEIVNVSYVKFSPNIAISNTDYVVAQYMSAAPNEPAIAWRTIVSDAKSTSIAISDSNKTVLLSDINVYSDSIEIADITVLGIQSETQSNAVWIGNERIDYWSVLPAPTAEFPNRGFLNQLVRGTYNTPIGNVSVLYDTIFYDGNGTTTYFAAGSGALPAGGNVVVYIVNEIQVDTAININVGSYSIVENPPYEPAGTYVQFNSAPPVGWRNVRIASPRSEVKFTSQISHIAGSTVISAGYSQTIPGGYQWIPTPNGLQYSSSSLARFLLNHPGTRS
jgi:hypothetical protein